MLKLNNLNLIKIQKNNNILYSTSRTFFSSSFSSLQSFKTSKKTNSSFSSSSCSCSSILNNKQRYFSTTATNNSNNDINQTSNNEQTTSNTETNTTSNNNLLIKKIEDEDDDYYDDYSSSGNRGGYKKLFSYLLFGGISSIVLYAGYSISMELFGRAAPNNLFNETFDLVRVNDEVMRMTGDPMRAYGMDTGRHTEGRRNFVASRKYKANDGSNRTRIRYTVSGPRGKAVIYAEVSDKMESHEFVYLITKDVRTGRVFTLVDNRPSMEPVEEYKPMSFYETYINSRKNA